MVRRLIASLLLFVLIVFLVPVGLHAAVWANAERPSSWNRADWSSAGTLPAPKPSDPARVMILAARTGGMKGAVATHSWLLVKPAGAARYDRYDVVGWGTPVRRNAYPPDGRWYSNAPVVHYEASGEKAERLIPGIERAVRDYRWRKRGDYSIFPGPNSNTFVASVVRAVPGFDAVVPPTALGRDYPADGHWFVPAHDGRGMRLSLGGYAGLVVGGVEGIEVNFMGTVAGFDPATWTLKVPGWGAIRLAQSASAPGARAS